MRLSLLVGPGVLALKITAYVRSYSQALLADVAESVVHQLAVGVATDLAYLQLHPADRNHPPLATASLGLFPVGLMLRSWLRLG